MRRFGGLNLARETFVVAATYIGTVVGAGFASGQETLRFFAAYGKPGLVGIGVSTLLFILYGYLVMILGNRLKARSHREVLHHVCGPKIGRLMDGVITLFLGGTFAVMVAGGGAVFTEQIGAPRALGVILTAGLAGVTILSGLRGILAANSLVVPMLTVTVLGLAASSVLFHGIGPIVAGTVPWPALAPVRSWFLAAWLYTGYNLVLSISVLAPLGAAVQDRRALLLGAVAGGGALGLLAVGIKLAVSAHMPEIGRYEVPMLFLARLHPRPVQWAYTAILWAEVYTTAIACAYGFARRMTDALGGGYRGVVVLATALALFISGFGFSGLVGVLYPLFGLVTLVVLFFLTAEGIGRRREGAPPL